MQPWGKLAMPLLGASAGQFAAQSDQVQIESFLYPKNPRFDGTPRRLSAPSDEGSVLLLVHRTLPQKAIGVE